MVVWWLGSCFNFLIHEKLLPGNNQSESQQRSILIMYIYFGGFIEIFPWLDELSRERKHMFIPLCHMITSLGMTNAPTWRSNSWIRAPQGPSTEARMVSSSTWRVYLNEWKPSGHSRSCCEQFIRTGGTPVWKGHNLGMAWVWFDS